MNMDRLRAKIDRLDDQLLLQFLERMALSEEIAAFKKENNLAVEDRGREREILRRVSEKAGDELAGFSRLFFSNLFDISRSYQRRLVFENTPLTKAIKQAQETAPSSFPETGVVACQGIEGAYSQLAVDKLFRYADIVYFKSFEGVFQAVEQGMCEFGVLPIDNSSYGSVNAVYDLMKDYRFHIARSIRLKIDHVLLAAPGAKLSDIKEIYSHDQAIGQCSEFFKRNETIVTHVLENTAVAAETVARMNRKDVAAISSRACAALYGLEIVAEGFQNSDSNYTRFICITKDLRIYPEANKISLILTTPHEPGSLYRLISKFAVLGINLTKLESRPIVGGEFEFMFYFDLDASLRDEEVGKLLGELSASLEVFLFLGHYKEV